jgi:two-component system sensor histidine kinase BaeS
MTEPPSHSTPNFPNSGQRAWAPSSAAAAPVPPTTGRAVPAGLPRRDPLVITEWPQPARPASLGLLVRAAVIGVFAAALFPGRPGLNVPLVGVVALVALAPVARRNRTSIVFATLALALAALPVLVDAGWIVALAIALAVPLGSYALTGGRTWIDLAGGGLAFAPAVPRAVPWAGRGVVALARSGRRPTRPVVGSLLLAGVLLVVFGALFATADAAFSRAVTGLLPDVRAWALIARILVFGGGAIVVLTGSFLAAAPPRFARPPAASDVGRTPWAIPIVALDLLFLGFVAVQADVLLATDRDRLLRSTGLSYAEYARQGFWQLLVVTGLVLLVLGVAVRYAPMTSRADRATVRTLLGLLCALTLVVVAVALRRLFLYEEAYGWTRLRLWVHAFELWMGLVIVLVAVAGIRLKAAWLPRAVAASGAVGLLALGLLNADGFIAGHNVDRFSHTGRADLSYLSGLSADAAPALDRLPEPQRSCALRHLAESVRHGDSWTRFNLSRERARDLLRRHPVQRAC